MASSHGMEQSASRSSVSSEFEGLVDPSKRHGADGGLTPDFQLNDEGLESSEGVTPAGLNRADWLSPPASPDPSNHPFFTESEQKKSLMVESKYYGTQHPDQLSVSPSTVMPQMASFMQPTASSSSGGPSGGSAASGTAPQSGLADGAAAVHEGRKRNPAVKRSEEEVMSPSQSRNASPARTKVDMPSGVPNFKYREQPALHKQLDPAEDEKIELSLDSGGDAAISKELQELYTSFQTCVELRDKYIKMSCQRLEDNPQNYDGQFAPRKDSTGASSAYQPATPSVMTPAAGTPAKQPTGSSSKHLRASANGHGDQVSDQFPIFDPWKIYPPPPKPHWEQREPLTNQAHSAKPYIQSEFHFEDVEIPGEHDFVFELDSMGVFQVYESAEVEKKPENVAFRVPTLKEYFQDLDYVLGVISDGPAKSFAYRRIKYLESRWDLYCLLNEYQELAEMKRVPHRDFYNVRKVDTHVHHSACMNQKHLLRFIKSKMKRSADDIVTFRDNKYLTLREVFESLDLTAYDLSIDTLDMHAHRDAFHRFDRFNAKYNPIGESRLREIFLKTDNHIKGRYLAEVTKEVFEDLHVTKYQMAEYRISIYGRSRDEWDKLAKWVVHNKLYSDNVRWLIQIPRLYEVFKAGGTVNSFGDVIQNIYGPLFEVTKDPRTHPELHVFLQRVIGFDSVDDESKVERRLYRKYPFPQDWNTKQNPPYNYWLFYLFANIATLNNWRKARGFNTFVLRPHAGEAGDTDHLTSAFLTSHSISHGILLRKVPALCYLYYLEQIGVAMSPLSNNALFLTYERNPFPQYFRLGLNVSLSTDDPLQLHYTKEPLMEEYSVAAQIYKLSPADMCELARNSCIQSGFEMEVKRHWLGHDWYLPGAEGNVVDKTNVPNVRVAFRYNTLTEERAMIRRYSRKNTGTKTPPLQTLETRPDLFPVSSPSKGKNSSGIETKDDSVASMAMASTAMPNLAGLKVTR